MSLPSFFAPLTKSHYIMPMEIINSAIAKCPECDVELDLLRQRIQQGNIDQAKFLTTMKDVVSEKVLRSIIREYREPIALRMKRSIILQINGYNLRYLTQMIHNGQEMHISEDLLTSSKKRVEELVVLYADFEFYGITWPDDMMCPLTKQIMTDPVFASDGHTYEREAIYFHLLSSSVSPMTSAVINSKTLISNYNLAARIKVFAMNALAQAKKNFDQGFAVRVQQEKDMLASQMNASATVELVSTRSKRKVG